MASNSSSHCFTPCVLSITRTAISVRLSICFVFRTRSSPRCPSSSKPGVSITITGPNGRSSIAFETGSVVVPFVSDTTANSCPVTAFTTLDFPAFLLPKKPICILSPDGVSFKLIKMLLSNYTYLQTILRKESKVFLFRHVKHSILPQNKTSR